MDDAFRQHLGGWIWFSSGHSQIFSGQGHQQTLDFLASDDN